MNDRHASTYGFTLIEVMVVLVMMGLLTGLASQRLTFDARHYDNRLITESVQALLEASQLHALRYRQNILLTYDKATGQFLLKHYYKSKWVMVHSSYQPKLTLDEGQGVEMVSNQKMLPDNSILFDANAMTPPFTLIIRSDSDEMIATLSSDNNAS